jgi:hypothetical protein
MGAEFVHDAEALSRNAIHRSPRSFTRTGGQSGSGLSDDNSAGIQ